MSAEVYLPSAVSSRGGRGEELLLGLSQGPQAPHLSAIILGLGSQHMIVGHQHSGHSIRKKNIPNIGSYLIICCSIATTVQMSSLFLPFPQLLH